MRWEYISKELGHEVYELWQKKDKLLTLTFHPNTNSARVETEGQRRVLLVRKEGFRKNKTVLRTEYGIKLGQLAVENKETVLEMNNDRLFFAIETSDPAELIIYKESKENPLAVCKLNIPDPKASSFFPVKNTVPVSLHSSLLLSLCWYLHLPVGKNRITEFAALPS